MKRFKELLQMFWASLNGNKTIIGAVIFGILQKMPLPEPYQSILITIVTVWTGMSFAHHVQKGYFKTSKGH